MVYCEIRIRNLTLPISLRGATEMHMKDSELNAIFPAHPKYHGAEWYDWFYVDYSEDENSTTHYPSLILGYINLPALGDNDTMEELAIVRTSTRPVPWEDVTKNFVQEFNLSLDLDKCHVAVPLESIVYPLTVFHDHGGRIFITLLKRCWSKYFTDQIGWNRT